MRTRRYAAVVARTRAMRRPGQRAVPDRAPIGYLPGDDVTPQEEQQVRMMAGGVPCGSALKPTYFAILGTPRYTLGPPAPYLYVVNRQVLDQNRNPLNRTMFVDESFDPDPPTGNCTNDLVSQGDSDTNEFGIFGPDLYSLDAGAPPGWRSSTTQHYRVTLDGVGYDIATKYRVTWKPSGVTVVCIAGC